MNLNDLFQNPAIAEHYRREIDRRNESLFKMLRPKTYLEKWRAGVLARAEYSMRRCAECGEWIFQHRERRMGYFGVYLRLCKECAPPVNPTLLVSRRGTFTRISFQGENVPTLDRETAESISRLVRDFCDRYSKEKERQLYDR